MVLMDSPYRAVQEFMWAREIKMGNGRGQYIPNIGITYTASNGSTRFIERYRTETYFWVRGEIEPNRRCIVLPLPTIAF